MDLLHAKSITIAYTDFLDVINRRTSNPIAETEIPEILRQAIRSGVKVIITDPLGQKSCQLIMNKIGQFEFISLS